MLTLTFTLTIITACYAIQTLWPLPASVKNGSNTITLCNWTQISIKSNYPSSPIIGNATSRFISYLQNTPSSFTQRQSAINKTSNNIGDVAVCLSKIEIFIENTNDDTLSISTNENYTLMINESNILIESGSVYGTVYGLITLSQLIRHSDSYNSNIINNSPWYINDWPVFKYRALMIDTGRNYLPVDLIKKTLFAMCLNKMNVLNWHMIDAQSFPIYIPSHPEFSIFGSYGIDFMYYPSDIKEIVSHAKNLGIRVIPEWESPGHDTSMAYGDPNIMTCDEMIDNTPPTSVCGEPPCGYLNLANQTGKQYVRNVFNEIYNDTFNLFIDNVIHIGGDEVSNACFGNETNNIYNEWMLNRILYLQKHNKTALMWNSNQNLNTDYGQNEFDILMIAWTPNTQTKITALQNGFKVIDANSNYYYLDCGLGNWQNPMGNSWCNPYRTWGVIYNHSLYDDIPLNETHLYKNILGGMVAMWGEEVDDGNFEARVWIRAAAAAGRWWTNKQLDNKGNDTFLRLQIQRYWMKFQGIMSSPITPQFCLQNVEYCNLHRHYALYGNNGMDYDILLNKYSLTQFIQIFQKEGWNLPKYWNEISIDQLIKWGFKSGDVVKFKHLLKDNFHL